MNNWTHTHKQIKLLTFHLKATHKIKKEEGKRKEKEKICGESGGGGGWIIPHPNHSTFFWVFFNGKFEFFPHQGCHLMEKHLSVK